MAIRTSTDASRPAGDRTRRRVALATAFSLLFMALLASFAQFGVLQTLIVPGDAAATTANIAASAGLFLAAIVAFAIVAILDILVAWGFYILLRPVNPGLSRLVGSLRIAYAAAFAVVLVNLFDVARLVNGATETGLQTGALQAQVAAALASFDTGWDFALGIFGLHLIGLGALLLGYGAPRPLAALVALAGIGYLADALGTILIADYGLTIGTFTFVGEVLLIVWLFWLATRGSRSAESTAGSVDAASAPAAS
jgi:hypothetical protein